MTDDGAPERPRAELAKAIPRRPRVSWWLGLVLAAVFALFVTGEITAERIFVAAGAGHVHEGFEARMTVRTPPFAGYETHLGRIGGLPSHDPEIGCKLCGGVVITRGEVATADQADAVAELGRVVPGGIVPYISYFLLAVVLAGLFAHHLRRSSYGRLLRVQLVSLALVLATAAIVKTVMLGTAVSILLVPVALFAMLPTLALDRVVGLATGTLAALVVSLLVPCDVSVIVLLLVQAGTAGLMIAERPKSPWRAALIAGGVSTLFTALTYPLLVYLRTWELPLAELRDPLHSPWVATVLGPALATGLAVPLLPIYQLLVGEITHGKLVELEDLSHPLLRQIAEKAPGTWQHSLMMANLAELAANAIGANGRLVRVGAYFHDLGKSLQPKYFIENLEPGETSPHDQLPPEASCDAIFSHVTEGILKARRAGLHERIVDFMHMHHGDGVLEYFWAKCREQGNPRKLAVGDFRYPGVPPQSRETAILAICDAVEAASRTLKKPDEHAIENLVQRIVYGKMHLGQLDESGLSAGDLRRIADSLRETIKHANHGRIEYPWQKAQQDASAGAAGAAAMEAITSTPPRLDSLDRPAKAEPVRAAPAKREGRDSMNETSGPVTPKLRVGANQLADSGIRMGIDQTAPAARPEPPKESPKTVVGRAPAPAADPEPSAGDAIAIDSAKLAAAAAMPSSGSPADTVARKPPPPPPKPGPSEREQFAKEAKKTLDEVGKEAAAIAAAQADTPSAVRKRAATIPPIKSVLVPPPKTTLAGPLLAKAPAKLSEEDSATTQPRMVRADEDEAPTSRDDTQPRLQLPLPSPASSLADRIDAQLADDNFGTDTPVSAPTKAELQALLNTAPDPTRVQSLDEIEKLKNLAENKRSGEMEATRRAPHPTAEVDEGDIEAAIELAPPARRNTTIGVAKKKTE